MKKLLSIIFAFVCLVGTANAYQVLSSKEMGRDDAKNQNVVVKCTTDTGKTSSEICSLRRYAKCTGKDKDNKNCKSWQPWRDLRNPSSKGFSDWKSAASACCKAKGLR